MHHDKIVEGKFSDHNLARIEAEKLAKAAAAALKKSRSECHPAVTGNPNNFGYVAPMAPKAPK